MALRRERNRDCATGSRIDYAERFQEVVQPFCGNLERKPITVHDRAPFEVRDTVPIHHDTTERRVRLDRSRHGRPATRQQRTRTHRQQ